MSPISFQTGTQTEVLWSGPPANYTSGGASSSSLFSLMTTTSGNYQQPYFPGGFWQQGRNSQLASYEAVITVSATSSTTTFTPALLLNTSPGTAPVATLATYSALTVTSYATGTVYLRGIIQNRGSGYGSSSVSTNLITSGLWTQTGNSLSAAGAFGPSTLATTDFSVNQWFALQGIFSTSASGNSATLVSLILRGEN